MADPTEVSPDICRGVSEVRERDEDEEGGDETENEVQHRIISQREVLGRHQVLVYTLLSVCVCVCVCVCERDAKLNALNEPPINYLIHYSSLNTQTPH